MEIQKYRRRENVKEDTLDSRTSALKRFKREMNIEGEPTPEDVEDWIDHLIELNEKGEISRGTIRQYYKSVRYYFQKMMRGDEEIEHIRDWIPSGGTDHGEYLHRDELKKMMGSVYNARNHAIYQIMYEYGRRPGEVRLLNMSDIDFDEETITFIILKKKELLRATFELLDDSKRAIEDYLQYRARKTEKTEDYIDQINSDIDDPNTIWKNDIVRPLFTTQHGRVSYDTIWKNIKNDAEKIGIERNITPKSMRHSRATHLDWDGNSPGEIARQQLVHEPDTDVIGAYIHDRDEDQVREVMTTKEE